MTEASALNMDAETISETSMVELAFQLMQTSNEPYYYRDLMQEIAKLKGMTQEDVNRVIAQLYTEINIDGRFACVGQNLWGLKRWYTSDRVDDAMATMRARLVDDDDDDDDDVASLFDEEEIDVYSGDDDFDSPDADDEEELDEVEEIDEDIEEEDEFEEDAVDNIAEGDDEDADSPDDED